MTRNQFCQLEPFVRLDKLLHGPQKKGRADECRQALVDLVASFSPIEQQPVLYRGIPYGLRKGHELAQEQLRQHMQNVSAFTSPYHTASAVTATGSSLSGLSSALGRNVFVPLPEPEPDPYEIVFVKTEMSWLFLAWALTMLVCWAQIAVTWLTP